MPASPQIGYGILKKEPYSFWGSLLTVHSFEQMPIGGLSCKILLNRPTSLFKDI